MPNAGNHISGNIGMGSIESGRAVAGVYFLEVSSGEIEDVTDEDFDA